MIDACMNRTRSWLPALLVLVGAPGCPADEDKDSATAMTSPETTDAASSSSGGTDAEGVTSTTDGGTTSAGSTGGPGGSECACIPDDQPGGVPSIPACESLICPVVEALGDGVMPLALADPAALECMLTALRDRKPGLVRWAQTDGVGQFTDEGYVLIHADGTAIRRSWGKLEGINNVQRALSGALPAPAEFEQCLAEPEDQTRLFCATWFVLEGPWSICDEGWRDDA